VKTKQHVALAEKRTELRLWKKWRRERLEALLADPHYGEPMRALLDFCKTVTGPSALIDFVKAGPWANTDADIRFEILALVDAVIIRRREKMGKAPFDDSVPWSDEPPHAFECIRELLL
jgi:hypothetical protein